jgi:hypothetical protein
MGKGLIDQIVEAEENAWPNVIKVYGGVYHGAITEKEYKEMIDLLEKGFGRRKSGEEKRFHMSLGRGGSKFTKKKRR